MAMDPDELAKLVDAIAEAVVAKLDEREKINAIADAVLAKLEDGQWQFSPAVAGPEGTAGAEVLQEHTPVATSTAQPPKGDDDG